MKRFYSSIIRRYRNYISAVCHNQLTDHDPTSHTILHLSTLFCKDFPKTPLQNTLTKHLVEYITITTDYTFRNRLLSTYLNVPSYPLISFIAVGSTLDNPADRFDSKNLLDASNMVRPSHHEWNQYYRLIYRLQARLYRHAHIDTTNAYTLLSSLGRVHEGPDAPIARLETISEAIHILRSATTVAWPVLGGPALHGLIRLIDPRVSPDNIITPVFVADIFAYRLNNLLSEILLVRRIGRSLPGSEPSSFLSPSQALAFTEANQCLEKSLSEAAHDSSTTSLSAYRRHFPSPFMWAAFSINAINTDLSRRGSRDVILKKIIALYCSDPHITQFLDWPHILSYISCPPSAQTKDYIFVLLIAQNPDFKIFADPHTLWRYSPAFVNTCLRNVMRREMQRRKLGGNRVLADLFKSAPTPIRILLTRHLQHRSNIEDIYPVLQNNQAGTIPTDVDIAKARITLLQRFNNFPNADRSELEREIEDEQRFLRQHIFTEMYRDGRIVVDWHILESEVYRLLSADMSLPALSKTTRLSIQYQKLVITAVSNVLAKHIYCDSYHSLNAVLSKNLRHGVFEPRILRAVRDTLLGIKANTDEYVIDVINKISSFISEASVQYMRHWLTTDHDGHVVGRLTTDISTIIQHSFSNGGIDEANIARLCIEKAIARAEEFSELARFKLDREFVPSIHSYCNSLFNMKRNSKTISAAEMLSIELNSAFNDVRAWISVHKPKDTLQEFLLSDLFRWIMQRFLPLSRAKHSKVEFFVRTNSRRILLPESKEPKFRGQFIEPLDLILSNLIANAVQHSGLLRSTSCRLQVAISDIDVRVRVLNEVSPHFSDDKIDEMLHKTLAKIRSAHTVNVGEEGGSGFGKIYSVYSDFGWKWVADAFRPTKSDPTFRVEFALPREVLVINEVGLIGRGQR